MPSYLHPLLPLRQETIIGMVLGKHRGRSVLTEHFGQFTLFVDVDKLHAHDTAPFLEIYWQEKVISGLFWNLQSMIKGGQVGSVSKRGNTVRLTRFARILNTR